MGSTPVNPGGTPVIGATSSGTSSGGGSSSFTLPANLTAVATDASGNAKQATAIPYSALTGTPTIPTNTNQLTNGSGFITASGAPVQTVAGRTGTVVLAAADVSGLAASATTDTTNAANIATGTLPAGRLPISTASAYGAVQLSGTATAILGTAANANTGTSGAAVPMLNGNGNVWTNTQTMPAVAAAASGNFGTLSLGSTGAAPTFTRNTNDAQPAFIVNLAGASSTALYIAGFKNQGTDVAWITPLGVLNSVSQQATGISTKAAAYTCTTADYTVLASASSAAFTVTLEAAPVKGQMRCVKKIDASANSVTVSGNGKNIDSGTNYVLTAQNQAIMMQYDGAQWWIL